THLELNRLRNHLEFLVEERTAELRKSEKTLRASLLDSIAALAATVEIRDPYTAGHQNRVAQLAVAIARELQLPEEQVEGIHLASIVHDVGKIQVPGELLSKPGKLSALEFDLIKEHAKAGYEILKPIAFPWPIAQIVLQHHERLDGSGYPQGLRRGQILPEACILAVADVVESMMSHRPYRPGLGLDAALGQVAVNKGTLFDPVIVDACLKLFQERGFHFSNGILPR
ncbi:MAG TPA: HD domain-containing phosphohydrolase, partial [Gallionella sp.]|nr:HD domain-containing phosphohydrolase [Gallionella sp.]